MIRRVLSLCLVGSFSAFAAPAGCIGSASITSFRLTVQPAGSAESAALPLLLANNVPSGARLAYRPVDLPADLRKDAKLTLVMVPQSPDGPVTVLEPKLAASPAEWQAPFAARIVLLVFAPQGLDEKRLTNLVTRDAALVATLADYADQTADLELQLELARIREQEAEEDETPRPNTPAEQALFALVRSLNPAVSGYDPLGAGRRLGPTTFAGKSTEEFFNDAGGFVPYGGILPMVRPWLLPDTEVRSVYATPSEPDGMTLCTKVQLKGKNKLAYMWAYRLAEGSTPRVPLAKDMDLPLGMRVTVPLRLDTPADWQPVSRIHDWALIPEESSGKPVSIAVRTAPDERAIHLDLRRFEGSPGAYRIQAKWDWDTVRVMGTVRLHRLDDFTTARLTPETQDKFIAATGPVPIDLTGADFLLVDHAWLHRPTNARQIPADLPPLRSGPSTQLRIEVDTDGLRPGQYLLALARVDGAVTDVPVRLLPSPPRMDTAGTRVNTGDRETRVTLAGTGLDRIERMAAEKADVTLEAANEDGTRRDANIKLHADAKPGDKLALAAKVEGMTGPVRFPGVLQVAAARPRIVEAKVSVSPDLAVAARDGEIPAGSWVSYALRVEPAAAGASLTLQCAEPALAVQPLKLRVGEKQASAQLVATGGEGWFLSLDPGAAGQSGCTLTAVMETEDLGKSDPFTLGKVVRLPRIESFTMTDEKSPDGFYAVLKGYDLETIAKTGWDGSTGVAASELPRPLVGEGSKQTLRIAMPWPSPTPKAPLYVWLRGEAAGRATKVNP
jgi:hypothetical protein